VRYIFILLIIPLMILSSCNTVYSKESYINSFERFITQTTANGIRYSEQDWLKADKLFRKYVSDYYNVYNSKLTQHERDGVDELRERYIRLRIINDSSALDRDESLYGDSFDFL